MIQNSFSAIFGNTSEGSFLRSPLGLLSFFLFNSLPLIIRSFSSLFYFPLGNWSYSLAAMLPLLSLLALLPISPLLVSAQDGSITGPTSSQEAAGYSCDSNSCKLPNCACASTSPPGGLDPVSLIHIPFSVYISLFYSNRH